MKGNINVLGHNVPLIKPKIKPKMITYIVLDWDENCPDGHKPIMTNVPIALWIEQQPVHMWKYVDLNKEDANFQLRSHFFVSEELLTWLKLRWS